MELFILLVVLVTLLIVTNLVAAYAERKGRSYRGFFILTFLFLPLGVLAAVLAEPNQKNIAISSNLVKCEFCAEYIKSEAKMCKHCGKEVSVKPISDIHKNEHSSAVNEYDAAESGVLLIVATVFGVILIFFLFTKLL